MPENVAPLTERKSRILVDVMTERIPFNRLLAIEVVQVAVGRVVFAIPFRPELIGDPLRPALHGGVLSALIDACGGAAVWMCVGDEDRVSTIDLRVDYLRPAPLETIESSAEVLRVGSRVGVVSMRVYTRSDPHTTLAEGRGVYSIKRAMDKDNG
jgi:uncharacterized protein (TIGR00369 family)